jgi:hypothetical protein
MLKAVIKKSVAVDNQFFLKVVVAMVVIGG